MAQITDILPKLIERSKQNKVQWQPTASDNAFTATIGAKSVIIQVNRSGRHALRILDEEGRELETLASGNSLIPTREDRELDELFRIARRIARQLDRQLDELLQELEKE